MSNDAIFLVAVFTAVIVAIVLALKGSRKEIPLEEINPVKHFISDEPIVEAVAVDSEYPTDLIEWIKYVKAKKPTYDELFTLISSDATCKFDTVYINLRGGFGADKKTKFLYNQWNKPKATPKKNVITTGTVVPTATKKPVVKKPAAKKPRTPKKEE